MRRVLVLGGSALTEDAVRTLAAAGHAVSVYWSRDADVPGLPTAPSLRVALEVADLVVDATHPFDDGLRAIAFTLAPECARVRLGRSAWVATQRDRWVEVNTLAEAVAAIPSGARVFAASGRDSEDLLTHHDGPVFLRQLHRHDGTPPPGCTYVFGEGPFEVVDEMALFQDLKIEVLLARNMGGVRGFPKLAAARALGLISVLIKPPVPEFETQFEHVEALLAWIRTS
ncbi:MAG: precorrin-6A/cobalt-precorrin-6A reductase [Pseudomonadota bacterium]